MFELTTFKCCVLTNDQREGAVETQTIRTQERRGRKHKDHTAERGHVTVARYNMVQKPIPDLKQCESLKQEVQ